MRLYGEYEHPREYDHGIWFWPRNMGWNIIRGNHVRQPRSSSPKRRELALFVLKIKMASNFSFFSIQVLFQYNSPREISSFRAIFHRIPLAPDIQMIYTWVYKWYIHTILDQTRNGCKKFIMQHQVLWQKLNIQPCTVGAALQWNCRAARLISYFLFNSLLLFLHCNEITCRKSANKRSLIPFCNNIHHNIYCTLGCQKQLEVAGAVMNGTV